MQDEERKQKEGYRESAKDPDVVDLEKRVNRLEEKANTLHWLGRADSGVQMGVIVVTGFALITTIIAASILLNTWLWHG